MSNYIEPTRHPETGEMENAEWLDNAFGRHCYGVRFPSDGIIRDARDLKREPEDIVARLLSIDWWRSNQEVRMRAVTEIERLMRVSLLSMQVFKPMRQKGKSSGCERRCNASLMRRTARYIAPMDTKRRF